MKQQGQQCLLVIMVTILLISPVLAHNPSDCMKNPFASGCRGISAKRSPVSPLASWLANLQSPSRADQQPANEPTMELVQLQLPLALLESPLIYPTARALAYQSQQRPGILKVTGTDRWQRDE